jgi:hypothetical protein
MWQAIVRAERASVGLVARDRACARALLALAYEGGVYELALGA